MHIIPFKFMRIDQITLKHHTHLPPNWAGQGTAIWTPLMGEGTGTQGLLPVDGVEPPNKVQKPSGGPQKVRMFHKDDKVCAWMYRSGNRY